MFYIKIAGVFHTLICDVNILTNQKYHLEISRYGDTLYAFLSGQLVGSLGNVHGTLAGDTFVIGKDFTDSSNIFIGYMGEIRVTRGAARHAVAFVPATEAYGPDCTAPGNDAYTKLLLHFDGAVGSSQIADSSIGGQAGSHQTVNNYGVVVAIQRNFAAGMVNPTYGTGMGNFNSGYLAVPPSSDVVLGNEWSLDGIFATEQAQGTLVAQWHTGGGSDRNFDISISGGLLSVYVNRGNYNYSVTSPFPVNDGKKHHFAVSYAYGVLYLGIDGKNVAQANAPGSGSVSTIDLCIGAFNASEGNYFSGIIDELRLSNGHARFVGDYVVPTQAYAA